MPRCDPGPVTKIAKAKRKPFVNFVAFVAEDFVAEGFMAFVAETSWPLWRERPIARDILQEAAAMIRRR